MANWKKIIVSGSIAELAAVTASSYTGSFTGDGSGLTGVSGDFPTVHLPTVDLDDDTQIFVFDGGASKFVSGSQLQDYIYTDVTGDITITADGVASLTGGAAATASLALSASTVFVTQHSSTPDPLYLVGVDSNGNDKTLYSTNQAGRSIFFDHSDSTFVVSDNLKIGDGSPAIAAISSSANTFKLLNTGVGTINFGGEASAISIGAGTSVTTIEDDLKVVGDLIVQGTTTTINTDNLLIEDKFILLSSASSAPDSDGGIIVQTSADGSGSALYYENSENRWAITRSGSVHASDVSASPGQYVVTVSSSNVSPTGIPSDFGNSAESRYGMMYVDTSDSINGGLYIYLP